MKYYQKLLNPDLTAPIDTQKVDRILKEIKPEHTLMLLSWHLVPYADAYLKVADQQLIYPQDHLVETAIMLAATAYRISEPRAHKMVNSFKKTDLKGAKHASVRN
jgi:hypothetical protein